MHYRRRNGRGHNRDVEMKKSNMKLLKDRVVGAKAVVSEMDDTVIYTINSIDGQQAHLTYMDGIGREVSGGMYPLLGLYEPTKEQLANAAVAA